MARFFHVSSVKNRDSITRHGLDSRLMGAAPGIAGSRGPEEDGIFLEDERRIEFFVEMNNTGGPVDVWAIDGIETSDLVESSDGSGFLYLPASIPPDQLTLVRTDIDPLPEDRDEELSGSGT